MLPLSITQTLMKLAGLKIGTMVHRITESGITHNIERLLPYEFVLPVSILKDPFVGSNVRMSYRDPLRQQLDDACRDTDLFNQYTVPPVNRTLEQHGVKLTEIAYKALLNDIKDNRKYFNTTQGLSNALIDRSKNQAAIATAFYKSGESAGGNLHSLLQYILQTMAKINDLTRDPDHPLNPAGYHH